MKTNIKQLNHNKYVLYVVSFLMGIAEFISIYGVSVLNVRYVDWLFNSGDLSAHYMGWLYYRKSPWCWPIGTINNFTDISTCIIYTDSIPLLAIPFKLIESILPENFQYFGIWGVMSFALMSVLSTCLIKKYNKNNFICWIASVFFVVTPYVLQRMFVHTSLASQWVLVLAILIWVNDIGKEKIWKKVVAWTLMLMMTALIHIYFIPMIVVFIFFDAIRVSVRRKAVFKGFLVFAIPIIWTILELWIVGAFGATGNAASDGLGYYSANLNTLFNSMWDYSVLFKGFNCGAGQYEGLGYLGAGMFFLLAVCVYKCIIERKMIIKKIQDNRVDIILLTLISIILCILAFSPKIMLGEETLVEIRWPNMVISLLGVFRSSGRFIWPVCYIVFLAIILIVTENNKRVEFFLLTLAIAIQIFDFSGRILTVHNLFAKPIEYVSNVDEDLWDEICTNKEKMVFLPVDSVYNNAPLTISLGRIAEEHDMTFNTFYVSRPDGEKLKEKETAYMEKVMEGDTEDKNVYIFPSKDYVWNKGYNLFFYNVDGIVVGVAKEIDTLENDKGKYRIDKGLEIEIKDMNIYNDKGEHSESTESSGLIRIGQGELMYGPYYSINAGYYLCTIRGYNLEDLNWVASSETAQHTYYIDTVKDTGESIVMRIVIEDSVEDLEIKAYNSGKESAFIREMVLSVL